MNFRDIKVLYCREVRSALRDRTIVTNSILLPIFLYPLMMWLVYTGITFISGQNEELRSRVMLINVPAAHPSLLKQFQADKSMVLATSRDPVQDIRNGTLDALVEFLPAKSNLPVDNNFATRITYDESRDQSNRARSRIDQKLSRYRDSYFEAQAAKFGLSREQFQDFWIDDQNVSKNRETGEFIAILMPIFFIIMLAVGGMHPAIDSTAGERENSTWETVMTSATSRANVLVAKYLYVATMSFTAAFLNLFAMIFSMGTILAPLLRGGAAKWRDIPLQSIPVILAGAVLLALFVAAGMMILASFAGNYKEGQSMVAPFYVALIIPIMFLQTPGMEFTRRIAFIPVANVTMMIREAMQGIYHWRMIGLTLAVEAACVLIALRVAMVVLQHEDFVMGSYSGNFGKFAKERLFNR
ncbi:MAG TPA: ABC transporter permease [Terriglobia bacterium]|jgi:sodium transport system permease protein